MIDKDKRYVIIPMLYAPNGNAYLHTAWRLLGTFLSDTENISLNQSFEFIHWNGQFELTQGQGNNLNLPILMQSLLLNLKWQKMLSNTLF